MPDSWAIHLCTMICRADAESLHNSFFGDGTGKIWLDNVDCVDFAHDIAACRHNVFGDNNCDHTEDVGVRCGSM